MVLNESSNRLRIMTAFFMGQDAMIGGLIFCLRVWFSVRFVVIISLWNSNFYGIRQGFMMCVLC